MDGFYATRRKGSSRRTKEELCPPVSGNGVLSRGKVKNISSQYPTKEKTKNVSLNYYKSSSGVGFSYWIYLPDQVYEESPILLYFTGSGAQGGAYKYNAIMIQPQLPKYDNNILSTYLLAIKELTDKVAKEFSSDTKKISVTGFSWGCGVASEFVHKYTNYFSAAVVVACQPRYNASTSDYSSTSLWAIVGKSDNKNVNFTRDNWQTVENFTKNVPDGKFTGLDGKGHGIVNDDYSVFRDITNPTPIEWALSKSRK